jgi:hypothetical protein
MPCRKGSDIFEEAEPDPEDSSRYRAGPKMCRRKSGIDCRIFEYYTRHGTFKSTPIE